MAANSIHSLALLSPTTDPIKFLIARLASFSQSLDVGGEGGRGESTGWIARDIP